MRRVERFNRRFKTAPSHYNYDKAKDAVLNRAKTGPVTLTTCQDRALDEIAQWYLNTDDISWTLIGSAGTGKSFLTDIVVRTLRMTGLVISAPTHKALRVSEGFTGIAGATIHKLLGLQPNFDLDDFDIHNPKFDPRNQPAIQNYNLILMEEASMLGDDLFTYLMNEANAHNTRILFIGDWCQLPPPSSDYIQQYKSGQLSVDPDTGTIKVMSKAFTETSGVSVLRAPARQSLDDPHYILLSALRSDIAKTAADYENLLKVADHFNVPEINAVAQNENFLGSHFAQLIRTYPNFVLEDGRGYEVYNDKYEFTDVVVEKFDTNEFEADPNYCRFIAFQNSTVTSWNKFIRDELIRNPDMLVTGDLIMAYKTVYDPEMRPMIINSNEYVVKELFNDKARVTIRRGGVNADIEFPYFFAKLEGIYTKGTVNKVNILKFPYLNFKKAHAFFLDEGRRKKRWQQYYAFKNNYLVFGDVKDSDYILPKKDLDYAYGITAHKAQGSTFQYVFTNLNDMLEHSRIVHKKLRDERLYDKVTAQMTNDITLKLIYVAASRAKQRVTLFYNAF